MRNEYHSPINKGACECVCKFVCKFLGFSAGSEFGPKAYAYVGRSPYGRAAPGLARGRGGVGARARGAGSLKMYSFKQASAERKVDCG
jgi:hypothetical protein